MEYFALARTRFDVPSEGNGAPFRKSVWGRLCEVPYGATVRCLQLARRLGKPGAARAGGLSRKECMLELEKKPK